MLDLVQDNESFRRLDRIQDNLYRQEPDLAHLLAMPTNKDIITREKQKQLRSV